MGARWGQICLAVALLFFICIGTEARAVNEEENVISATGLDSPRFLCDACLQLSNEAQLILSDPETEKVLEDLFRQFACENLSPNFKPKCVDMVKIYVPDLMMALQAYLRPELCTESGFCAPQLTVAKDTKTCALCQDFAMDALTYLGSNRTKSQIIVALHLACSKLDELSKQCDLLVDVYAPQLMAHLDMITPEEFCEMTRLCKPALDALQLKRNDCAICQFVILEMKIKLRDPKTQEKLVEILSNTCNRVKGHEDECKLIVMQYAPYVLANLDNILDADALCTKVRVCPQVREVKDFDTILVMPSAERAQQHRHAL